MTDRAKLKFNLEGYYFTKICLESLDDVNGEFTGFVNTQTEVTATELENKEIYVNLTVFCNEEICQKSPYEFNLSLTAKLQLLEESIEDDRIKEVTAALVRNGASICYAAAREKLLELTSRSVWGQAMISPNYFNGLRKEVKKSLE